MPAGVVNAQTGAIAQRIDYDEWGQGTRDSNPGFQPFGYAGGLYGNDTVLVRFGERDYDPSIRRWMARDPINFRGGSANLYTYVHNAPLNFVDRSGLGPKEPRRPRPVSSPPPLPSSLTLEQVSGRSGYTPFDPENPTGNRSYTWT
jgi:RHS repeat-associated protein